MTDALVKDDEWVGTKLLFENDIVRVWDFHLPPGSSTKMHTHRRDWLYVNVTGGNQLRADYPALGESSLTYSEDGSVTFRFIDEVDEKKRTHQANNVGTTPIRQVLIEFKRSEKSTQHR